MVKRISDEWMLLTSTLFVVFSKIQSHLHTKQEIYKILRKSGQETNKFEF
jgi:hypothetical protein